MHKITDTLNVALVIFAGKVGLICFYRFVTVQNGGNNTFNLEFSQGDPVNLDEGI